MKGLILSMALLAGSAAFADGFVCVNYAENIKVQVYNNTQPEEGTRNSAIMVVSDPSVQSGRKTIATFEDADSLLINDGTTYTAKVDLRYNNSGREGENILGTKLGNVSFIVLDVDFNYSQPIRDGGEVAGELIVQKRNKTEDIRVDVYCTRYLKGE